MELRTLCEVQEEEEPTTYDNGSSRQKKCGANDEEERCRDSQEEQQETDSCLSDEQECEVKCSAERRCTKNKKGSCGDKKKKAGGEGACTDGCGNTRGLRERGKRTNSDTGCSQIFKADVPTCTKEGAWAPQEVRYRITSASLTEHYHATRSSWLWF